MIRHRRKIHSINEVSLLAFLFEVEPITQEQLTERIVFPLTTNEIERHMFSKKVKRIVNRCIMKEAILNDNGQLSINSDFSGTLSTGIRRKVRKGSNNRIGKKPSIGYAHLRL